MIKIFRYLKPKEWLFATAILIFIVLQVWLDLTLPEYMGKITQLVQTPGSKMSEILKAGLMMFIITLGSVVASIIVAGFAAKIAANLSARLRSKVFDKVNSFTMKEINNFSIASLITRSTNDVTQVQTLIVTGLQVVIKSPILVVWAIIKILNKSWQWSAATAIAVAALIVIAAVFIILAIPKFKIIQQQTDELNRISRENLIGVRVIRAYNAENYQQNKFDKANASLTSTNLFTNRLIAILMPGVDLIMNGLSLAVYWVGAALITSVTVGERFTLFSDMMTFSLYAIQLLMAFMMLVMIFVLIPRASVSAKRINEVLETEPMIKDGEVDYASNEIMGEIEFKNVSFKYPDAQDYVIKNISFKAKKGETIAFVGSTGCGKSTVINLIPRFYDTSEGEVLIDGVNVNNIQERRFGIKLDMYRREPYCSKSISYNVGFGSNGKLKKSREDIVSAVEVAQGTDFVENMENTYDGFVASGGTNLSGGQKQRISIARAIARNPEFLIFDDSFSALDYITDRMLRSDLKKKTNNATVLIVAQRIGTIKDADKIIVLEDGNVAGMGTHNELMDSCSVYKEIGGRQYTLPELKRFVRFEGAKNIFGSLVVTTKTGIPVKIVFVRNRNKKSKCLYILSTNCSLDDAEIVRIYGNR